MQSFRDQPISIKGQCGIVCLISANRFFARSARPASSVLIPKY
jgi:hypothetical protein